MESGRIIFINCESTVDTFAKKMPQAATKTEPRDPFSLKGFLDRIVEWIALDNWICSSI